MSQRITLPPQHDIAIKNLGGSMLAAMRPGSIGTVIFHHDFLSPLPHPAPALTVNSFGFHTPASLSLAAGETWQPEFSVPPGLSAFQVSAWVKHGAPALSDTNLVIDLQIPGDDEQAMRGIIHLTGDAFSGDGTHRLDTATGLMDLATNYWFNDWRVSWTYTSYIFSRAGYLSASLGPYSHVFNRLNSPVAYIIPLGQRETRASLVVRNDAGVDPWYFDSLTVSAI